MSSLSSASYDVSALAGVGEQTGDPRRIPKVDSFDIFSFQYGHLPSRFAAIEETLHQSD